VDAGQAKLGRKDALQLAKQTSKIIVAKSRRVQTFDMQRDQPQEAELLKALLGPTGNLRAPVVKKGRTLLVGFNAEVYEDVL